MVGRVRRKLAAKLQTFFDDTGYECRVSAESLTPNQGYWRIDFRADVMPWRGTIEMKLSPNGAYRRVGIGSWITMSELIKSDVAIEGILEIGFWEIEIDYDRETPIRQNEKRAAR